LIKQWSIILPYHITFLQHDSKEQNLLIYSQKYFEKLNDIIQKYVSGMSVLNQFSKLKERLKIDTDILPSC